MPSYEIDKLDAMKSQDLYRILAEIARQTHPSRNEYETRERIHVILKDRLDEKLERRNPT